jgi:hypothetical protein
MRNTKKILLGGNTKNTKKKKVGGTAPVKNGCKKKTDERKIK